MLMNQFANTLIQNNNTCIINEGSTESNVFQCAPVQPRALYFPSNWTECNISFQTQLAPNGPFFTKTNVDGSPLSIPTVPSQELNLLAYLFDATPYMRIVCSIAQAEDATVFIGFQPMYQGIHG